MTTTNDELARLVLRLGRYVERDLDELLKRLHWEMPLFEEAGNVSSFQSAEFGGFKRRFRTAVNRIVAQVEAGTVTPTVAAGLFQDVYQEAAENAYRIGLERAGMEFGTEAAGWIHSEVTGAVGDFSGFMMDVESGSVMMPGGTPARQRLYVDRLDGVRASGWARAGQADNVLWWWRLTAGDICDDCIVLHTMSPFRGIAPTVPGMGGTICGARCRCVIIRTLDTSRRESYQLRAVEDLIADARALRLNGTPSLEAERRVVEAVCRSGYDPHRAVQALYGKISWEELSLSADTIHEHS